MGLIISGNQCAKGANMIQGCINSLYYYVNKISVRVYVWHLVIFDSLHASSICKCLYCGLFEYVNIYIASEYSLQSSDCQQVPDWIILAWESCLSLWLYRSCIGWTDWNVM